MPSPLTESVSPVAAASAQELGTVIATLNDWRAILVVAFAIIGVLIVMVGALVFAVIKLAGSRSANDQATLQALQDNTAAFADLSASVRAIEMIAARRESEGAK